MLQRTREWLTILLVALLPFHALFVTVTTKVMAGPGHAPLVSIALWKEGLLSIIVLLAIIECLLGPLLPSPPTPLPNGEGRRWLSFDLLDCVILLALLYAFGMQIAGGGEILDRQFLLGFKYDFIPLVSFLILRRVEWSEWFWSVGSRALLLVASIVSVWGIATLLLPMEFFTILGYSDLHSLYVPEGPLAAFQQISGTALRRVQSTMSGPNQLGLWLLIPLAILCAKLWHEYEHPEAEVRFHYRFRTSAFALLPILGTALLLTFSRTAWIGAAVILAWSVFRLSNRRLKGVALSIVLIGIPAVIALAFAFPQILVRFQSSGGHFRKPAEAIERISAYPLGLGLGTAGPASNAASDTCVDLPSGSDSSWAKDRPDLCVFIGGEQVQPMDRACQCPLHTENWYLQWGVEMGIIGLILSILIPVLILLRLPATREPLPALVAFLGLSVAGLFLHAFEDSAVAYTVWVLLGATLSLRPAAEDACFRKS